MRELNMIYLIKPGDTLSSIANEFDVPIENILHVNRHIVNPDLIFAGTCINIPIPSSRFTSRKASTKPGSVHEPPSIFSEVGRRIIKSHSCPHCGRDIRVTFEAI